MKKILLSTLVLSSSLLMAAEAKAPKKAPAKPAPAAVKPAPEAPHAAKPAAEPTHAAKAPEAHGGKYGMAGCGLGALVVDRDDMLPQLGAWLLNGIYSNQTYGMTSGTSNCVESRTDMAAMEQEVFVAANLSSLSKEAAQGSGEHLSALAEVLGCKMDSDKARLGELSQNRYSEIFAQQEPTAVLNRYLTVVNADPMLAKSCTKAS